MTRSHKQTESPSSFGEHEEDKGDPTVGDARKKTQILLPDPKATTCIKIDGAGLPTEKDDDDDGDGADDFSLDQNLLRNLLHPLKERVFLEECFRECAVHVSSSNATSSTARSRWYERVSRHALFDLDPEGILEQTASDAIFVWLQQQQKLEEDGASSAASSKEEARSPAAKKRKKSSTDTAKSSSGCSHPASLIQSIEVSDAAAALALYRAGHATYCRAPAELERRLVRALLRGTGMGCGRCDDPTGGEGQQQTTCMGRGEAEVFMSAAAGCVTGWHTDFQENFTLQLSGVKRWTLQRGTVRHPVRGCTPHYRSPESVEPQLLAARLADEGFTFGPPVTGQNAVGDVDSVIVRPGDLLYFPAGMWHKVEVLEPGVSINISLMATNYASLTCQALQHVLLRRDSWRQCVVDRGGSDDRSGDVVEHLRSLLRELPDIVREFEANGGAEAIVPPALRRRQNADLTDCVPEGQGEAPGPAEMPEEESDQDGESEEGDEPVDASSFHLPSHAKPFPTDHDSYRELIRTHRLVKNPLATLLEEDDVTGFYDDAQTSDHVRQVTNGNPSKAVYILNVNYAGNEGHESALRVRIRAEIELMELIKKYLVVDQTGDQRACAHEQCHDLLENVDSVRPLIECLLYYGFLLWT